MTWYAKDGSDEAKAKANADELARIKEAEAEAMAIALYVILSKQCTVQLIFLFFCLVVSVKRKRWRAM